MMLPAWLFYVVCGFAMLGVIGLAAMAALLTWVQFDRSEMDQARLHSKQCERAVNRSRMLHRSGDRLADTVTRWFAARRTHRNQDDARAEMEAALAAYTKDCAAVEAAEEREDD